MSQQAAAAQLRPQQVINHMLAISSAQGTLVTALEEAQTQAIEAGMMYSGDAAKVQAMREEMAELLRTGNEVAAYTRALQALSDAYVASLGEATDFEVAIANRMKPQLDSFNPMTAPAMKEYKKAAGIDELEEDEDLQMEDDLLNTKCPISGKLVEELDDPVEDEKGYIYERSAIANHIRTTGGGTGFCITPVYGANHRVYLNKLTKSLRLERWKRKERLGLNKKGRGGAGGGRQEEIIDV